MPRRRTYRRSSAIIGRDADVAANGLSRALLPVGGTRQADKAAAKAAAVPPSFLGGDVVAGSLARAASQSTIHPIDTIKVRMQAADCGPPSTSGPAAVGVSKWGRLSPPPAAGQGPVSLGHPGFVTAGRRGAVAAVARVGSLYKGCWGAAGGASLAMAFYFGFYGASTRLLTEHTDLGPSGVAFVAGAAGAIGSSIVKIPAAVCIRSVQASVYPNVVAAARQIVAAVGPRGLYTGYIPTLLEDVPDMAVKFACYETVRRLHKKVTGRNTAVYEDLAYGGVSGALAAAVSTPLDVIKTRMMTTAASRPTITGAFQQILRDNGHKGFMRGVGPRALSNGINSAIFFFFFEAIRGVQKRAWQRQMAADAAAGLDRSAAGVTGHLFFPSRRRLLFRKGTAVQ